jgi:hypothetical protein
MAAPHEFFDLTGNCTFTCALRTPETVRTMIASRIGLVTIGTSTTAHRERVNLLNARVSKQ